MRTICSCILSHVTVRRDKRYLTLLAAAGVQQHRISGLSAGFGDSARWLRLGFFGGADALQSVLAGPDSPALPGRIAISTPFHLGKGVAVPHCILESMTDELAQQWLNE